jgi:hypothetical protein
MIRECSKIYILIVITGVISIMLKAAFFSSSGQGRNSEQLFFNVLQTPAKNGENQLMTADINENEFQVNIYTQESPVYDGITHVTCYTKFSEKYYRNTYWSPSDSLLRNLIISELDMPPPLIS